MKAFRCHTAFVPNSSRGGFYVDFKGGNDYYFEDQQLNSDRGIQVIVGYISAFVTNEEVEKYGEIVEADPVPIDLRKQKLEYLHYDLMRHAPAGVIFDASSVRILVAWLKELERSRIVIRNIKEAVENAPVPFDNTATTEIEKPVGPDPLEGLNVFNL